MRVRAVLLIGGILVASQTACNDDPAPLFQPTGNGSVAGRVFFDIDGNGQFNPLLGDTLAGAGVTVEVRLRGTTTVLKSGVTDANGDFLIEDVPVGTQDLFVPSQAVTGSLVFCVNPAPTSVYIGEQAYRTVAARNGCVIRIAAAEAKAQGEIVTIYGVVASEPGIHRADNFYIQDPSGGIQVFNFNNPGNLTLQRGDSVEVTGTLGNFNTELQIGTQAARSTLGVTKKAGTVPTPKPMTAAEIIALTNPTEEEFGLLLTIRKVTVGSFASGNATITDVTGSTQVRLDGAAATRIPTSTFQAGKCYDLTGPLGTFNGLQQIKVRDLNDIVEVPCT